MTAREVYSLYFHGPAYQVVTSAWRSTDARSHCSPIHLPDNHQPASFR